MAEKDNDKQEATEQPPVTPPSSDETEKTEPKVQHSVSYDRFKEVNDEKKQLREKVAALETAEQERQRSKLEAEGNYKQIIDEMTPQVERAKVLEEQLQEYQDRDKAELEAKLALIDVDMRGLMTDSGLDTARQLAFIRKLEAAGVFTKPSPPETDSGVLGDPKNPQPEESEATRNVRKFAEDMGFNAKRRT